MAKTILREHGSAGAQQQLNGLGVAKLSCQAQRPITSGKVNGQWMSMTCTCPCPLTLMIRNVHVTCASVQSTKKFKTHEKYPSSELTCHGWSCVCSLSLRRLPFCVISTLSGATLRKYVTAPTLPSLAACRMSLPQNLLCHGINMQSNWVLRDVELIVITIKVAASQL